jgi:tyrosine-specific transport protein
MEERGKAIRKSILTVLGTIIGAGIFGLPALFAEVGFWPGTVLFWALTLLILLTHYLYIEVILRTKGRMRLAGHAEHWLGPIGFWIAAVTYPLQIIGVNFVYLLLGGGFLADLAQQVGVGRSVLFWQLLFWAIGSVTVFVGLKFVAKVESAATWLLIAGLLAVILMTGSALRETFIPPAHWDRLFFPFGVFLFAVSGLSIIGEAADLVKRNRRDAYLAVTVGTLGAALLSWLFGVTLSRQIIGSTDAISSIGYLMINWRWLIPTVGFLAIATSYITTAQDLKATFHLDFRIPKTIAWFLALFTPMLLLFVVKSDFLNALNVIGTLFTGANGILVAMIAWMVWRKHRHLTWIAIAAPCVAAAFLFGIIHKFFF